MSIVFDMSATVIDKKCIRLINYSQLVFVLVNSGGTSMCGMSAEMLVFEDEEYFKIHSPEKFEHLRHCIIPIIGSNKNGILIS